MMLTHVDLSYSLAGLLVGALVGLTGVGGGSLMTPLLVLVLGFHPSTAVGTDLLYASVTKSVGSVAHHRHRQIDWGIVGRLALGSVPLSIFTLWVVYRAGPLDRHADHIISVTLGVVLVATALAMVFRRSVVRFAVEHRDERPRARVWYLTVLLGAVLGVLVSLTSVGAGAIGMTALIMLYPNHPVQRLVGSDIAHAVPLTLVAGLGHWLLGTVDGLLLVSLLIGSLPGILIGSFLAARAPERVLRPILATVLAVVGAKLLFA